MGSLLEGIGKVLAFVTIAVPFLLFVQLESLKFQVLALCAILTGDLLFVRWLFRKNSGRKRMVFLCALWLLLGALGALAAGFRYQWGAYRDVSVTAPFFSGKNVMVIVPHQDDELNLAEGLIEQYTKNDSRVMIVFATNGDNSWAEETRFREALDVAAAMGVAKEDVCFLGYGDQWDPMMFDGEEIAHIYNSPQADAIWTSQRGKKATYGTSWQDCYEAVSYTRENYVGSLYRLINEVRPDVIYASDYDTHIDHKALSLFVEEAMCRILAGGDDYHPLFFKGYCYQTAWYAEDDFAESLNILSTKGYTDSRLPYYSWEERIRFPVHAGGLNRMLTGTDGYAHLSLYASQEAWEHASGLVNGDKVFWQRRTDSVLYDAEICVDGVPTKLLNDFKLRDSSNVNEHTFDLGVQKVNGIVLVSLPETVEMEAIAFYDDPSGENQILEGLITLDNGAQVEFGPLKDDGSVTVVPIPRQSVQSFTVQVDSFRGTEPGLMELEAYERNPEMTDEALAYFMFADEGDNFVYDYYVDSPEGTEKLRLYTYPHDLELEPEKFRITMTGSDRCGYTFQDGILTVTCPRYADCAITVGYGEVSCEMVFFNPGYLEALVMKQMQLLDHGMVYGEGLPGATVLYYQNFFEKILHFAKKITG